MLLLSALIYPIKLFHTATWKLWRRWSSTPRRHGWITATNLREVIQLGACFSTSREASSLCCRSEPRENQGYIQWQNGYRPLQREHGHPQILINFRDFSILVFFPKISLKSLKLIENQLVKKWNYFRFCIILTLCKLGLKIIFFVNSKFSHPMIIWIIFWTSEDVSRHL